MPFYAVEHCLKRHMKIYIRQKLTYLSIYILPLTTVVRYLLFFVNCHMVRSVRKVIQGFFYSISPDWFTINSI